MKFSITPYFNNGDRVQKVGSKMTGTVVRAGERPLVQWDNGLQNDVFHIKLIGVDVKGKIEKIKDKIYEIRNKLGV